MPLLSNLGIYQKAFYIRLFRRFNKSPIEFDCIYIENDYLCAHKKRGNINISTIYTYLTHYHHVLDT